MIKNVPPTIIGNTTNGAPTTTIGANSNAPINKNVKNQKILTYGIGFLFVVLLVVFTWKVLVPMFKKKTSVAADVVATAPGAVTGVTAVNSSTTTTTTTESYTSSVPNKRGLIIKFNTPATSGGVNSNSITSYNVYLRAVVTPPDNKEYLVDKDSVVVPKPAFTKFSTGSNKDTYYEWNDSKRGATAGGAAAELFIDGSIIAALTDGATYKVGIQATNVNELSSPEITFSEPLDPYNKCKAGEDRGCGWDSDGINTALGKKNAPFLAPAFLSLALTASGSYTGSTADDTVCTTDTPVANTLYKFKSGVCVASACTKSGEMLVSGVCTHINMPGGVCVPPNLPADAPTTGFILYNQKNPDGSLTVDTAGSNVYICDLASGSNDARTKSCETITGAPLPVTSFSKWGLQPGCLITCLDDTYVKNTNGTGCRAKTCAVDKPKPNASTYAAWPGCAVTACDPAYRQNTEYLDAGAPDCIAKTCAYDMTPIPATTNTWTGSWNACQNVCDSAHWGPTCYSTFPTANTPAMGWMTSWTYDLAGADLAQPHVFVAPYIFGKSYGVTGLYKKGGAGTIKQWELPTTTGSVFSCTGSTVKVGLKTFTAVITGITNVNATTLSASTKIWTIDAANGSLVIKYTVPTPSGFVAVYMRITIDMIVNGAKSQSIQLTLA